MRLYDPPPVVDRGDAKLLFSSIQALHGLVKKEAEGEAKDTVVVSRSHTGQGGDVVTQYIKGHKPLFAGGSGFKALKVLKVSSILPRLDSHESERGVSCAAKGIIRFCRCWHAALKPQPYI
jgi:hypothetical protein